MIQVIYFFVFIEQAYLKDHYSTLEKLASRRGYEDMEELPFGDPLRHEGDIVNKKNLWVLAAVFYLFSLLWFTSYFKLIFTDIGVKESDESGGTVICQKCQVVRRPDMYHCKSCNVCCELYDHHCDVFQVCICGKNYKYFILFFVYGAFMCISVIASLI